MERRWTILITLAGVLLGRSAAAETYEPADEPAPQPDEPAAEPDDEPAKMAAPEPEPSPDVEGEPLDEPTRDNHGAGLIILGLRGTHSGVYATEPGGDERSHFGMGVSGIMKVLHTEDGVSGRFQHDWHLGGGAGFEGRLRGLATVGVAPWDHDTPFLRAGLGGGLEGNDALYFSHFELPVGEAGFHHSDEDFVFELGGRAAATLTSRYRAGFPSRRGGIEPTWGAFATLFAGPLMFDATFMRIQHDVPLTAGWAQLCAADGVSLCMDGALYHSKLLDQDVFASYVGLTFGVGYSGPWSRDI